MTLLAADRANEIRIRVDSEFGIVMAELVAGVPNALGAVLNDPRGDAIDFAYRPAMVSDFDVEVSGAQIGQPLNRTHLTALANGLGRTIVVAEASRGTFLAGMIHGHYLLTMIMTRGADLPAATHRFGATIREIATLLR